MLKKYEKLICTVFCTVVIAATAIAVALILKAGIISAARNLSGAIALH